MYICFSASPVAPRWAKITYLPARHFARLITRTQCASHHSFRNTLVRLLLLKSTVHVLSNRHTHALAPSEKWLPTTINFAFLNTPWLSPTLSLTHVPPPLSGCLKYPSPLPHLLESVKYMRNIPNFSYSSSSHFRFILCIRICLYTYAWWLSGRVSSQFCPRAQGEPFFPMGIGELN